MQGQAGPPGSKGVTGATGKALVLLNITRVASFVVTLTAKVVGLLSTAGGSLVKPFSSYLTHSSCTATHLCYETELPLHGLYPSDYELYLLQQSLCGY